MKRALAALLASCACAMGLVGVAQPANAETTVTAGSTSVTPLAVTDNQFTVVNGNTDSIGLQSTYVSHGGTRCTMGMTAAHCVIAGNSSKTFDIYSGTITQNTLVKWVTGIAAPGDLGSFLVTYRAGSGTGSGTGSGDTGSTVFVTGPGPHVQQFGMPESGTCDEAASVDLNWSGVASGGWGESWAQWLNDGKGGAVCSRTLSYSTAHSKWVVN